MATEPRGIRTNNPGNLRPGFPAWNGEVAPDGGYCCFITPESGLRAMGKTLLAYQAKHGLRTIRGIINRWAPPSDNNDTTAYVNCVAAECGIGPDVDIDLTDASVLSSMLMAIVQHENGKQPYSIIVLERAASLAVGDGLSW